MCRPWRRLSGSGGKGMTAVEAMRRLELTPSTFYRKVKQVR